jgi:hypothetical protein
MQLFIGWDDFFKALNDVKSNDRLIGSSINNKEEE